MINGIKVLLYYGALACTTKHRRVPAVKWELLNSEEVVELLPLFF